MNSRRFHVTLPSNSSMDCYPTNTAAQFTTKLPHQIALEGDWEVALTEISVPITLDNVTKETCFVELSTWTSERTYKYAVESGYYDSLVQLMNSLSEVLVDKGITFALWTDKAKMENNGDYQLCFSPSLAKKLGFNHLTHYSSGHYIARNPPDMSPETVPALFVYCDALEHVVVGDLMAPLLRIVDMKRTADNGRMHKILNPPLYVPLQKKNFDTIEINIMTDTGKPVPFAHDKSVAVLEFKRIGLLEKVI